MNGTFGKVHTRRIPQTGKEEINKLTKFRTQSPLESNSKLTFKFMVFIESSEVISFERDQALNKVQFGIYIITVNFIFELNPKSMSRYQRNELVC